MKTLKTIFLGLTFLLSTAAFAAQTTAAPLSKKDALSIYINALVHGQINNVENALDKNVKHTIYRGDKQFKLDKKQILETLKASENVEQSCKFDTQVVSEDDNGMLVKLTMTYEGYTRTNMITISSNKGDFKITKIETLA